MGTENFKDGLLDLYYQNFKTWGEDDVNNDVICRDMDTNTNGTSTISAAYIQVYTTEWRIPFLINGTESKDNKKTEK